MELNKRDISALIEAYSALGSLLSDALENIDPARVMGIKAHIHKLTIHASYFKHVAQSLYQKLDAPPPEVPEEREKEEADTLVYEPLPSGWGFDSAREVYVRRDGKEVRQISGGTEAGKWRAFDEHGGGVYDQTRWFEWSGEAMKDLDHDHPLKKEPEEEEVTAANCDHVWELGTGECKKCGIPKLDWEAGYAERQEKGDDSSARVGPDEDG